MILPRQCMELQICRTSFDCFTILDFHLKITIILTYILMLVVYFAALVLAVELKV